MTKTKTKTTKKPKVILKKGKVLTQKQMDKLLKKFQNADIPIVMM